MRVVIFDMDGTLIDSRHDITRSINHVRECNHGLPPLESATVVEWINMPSRNLSELFYGTPTYEVKDQSLFETHYDKQCIENPTLFPGIELTLEALRERDVRLAVATNAPSRFARRMIAHLGVEGHFDSIVGPDTVGNIAKPDPTMLRHIFDALGFAHDEHRAWMVGDNSKDMQAARAAGISGIFCTWGFSDSGSGDWVINHPEALLDIV